MTAADHTRGVRIGGEVHLPADLRIPVKGERDPESLRAILWAFLVEQLREDRLPFVVLAGIVVGGLALVVFLIATLP